MATPLLHSFPTHRFIHIPFSTFCLIGQYFALTYFWTWHSDGLEILIASVVVVISMKRYSENCPGWMCFQIEDLFSSFPFPSFHYLLSPFSEFSVAEPTYSADSLVSLLNSIQSIEIIESAKKDLSLIWTIEIGVRLSAGSMWNKDVHRWCAYPSRKPDASSVAFFCSSWLSEKYQSEITKPAGV